MEYKDIQQNYQLLPFHFLRMGTDFNDEILLTTETGEYLFIDSNQLEALVNGCIEESSPLYKELLAKHFIFEPHYHNPLLEIAAQYKSRKAFIFEGPALHLFVITLRCNHTCQYCQVSRAPENDLQFNMSTQTIKEAVNRVFESPSPVLTIEFQGGEPLLNFDLIKHAIELIEQKNEYFQKDIQYIISSTLYHLTHEIIDFSKQHNIYYSTSLDGPAFLHNKNRPTPQQNAYERTIDGIHWIQEALGTDKVSALTTVTALSLEYPQEIIDEYIKQNLNTISLRSLTLLGFAKKSEKRLNYSLEQFINFFIKATNYLLEVNKQGIYLSETYCNLLLNNILTPFSHGYVDLRSPTGGGIGALVYNYDGYVYPSDEARMLAEMGENDLRLGNVSTPLKSLLISPAMELLLSAGVNENLPGCCDCAYLPYCGTDPIDHYARFSDPIGHKQFSVFCKKNQYILHYLFSLLWGKDENTLKVLISWINNKSLAEIPSYGYMG